MWNGDVIRHNFKWNICDVMKRKDLKECYYGVMLTSFTKTHLSAEWHNCFYT